MSEEFDAIDELGKAAHMPPRSTRKVLIVDPGRIAELEAEVERLREALKVYADEDNWSFYLLAPFELNRRLRTWMGEYEAWKVARKALEPQP